MAVFNDLPSGSDAYLLVHASGPQHERRAKELAEFMSGERVQQDLANLMYQFPGRDIWNHVNSTSIWPGIAWNDVEGARVVLKNARAIEEIQHLGNEFWSYPPDRELK